MGQKNDKIIYIDIGTHFGQEYQSIFGSHKYFAVKIFRRLVGYYIFRTGNRLGAKYFIELVKNRSKLRSERQLMLSFFVEANPKIIASKNIYKNVDGVFNLAVTGNDKVEIINLFLANNDELSQGSSILLQKSNVSTDQYVSTLGVPAEVFFEKLQEYLQERFEKFSVILRLNCEGVEDDVIYAAHKIFADKLKLIMGSLKDVQECKGQLAYDNLQKYIRRCEIPFQFFSASVSSWGGAFAAIWRIMMETKR